jgi:IMP dehydrogenase/GMP reductase
MLFDFDDILIEPEVHTSIRSRKNVDVLDEGKMLPLFTAPMDTVIDNNNSKVFNNHKIYGIIPRLAIEYPLDYFSTDYKVWYSYGLDDFKRVFIDNRISLKGREAAYALIDVANGHMDIVKELVEDSKKIYGQSLILMVGNCANPYTFLSLSSAGADYVRMGIGNGAGCLTTVQTGIGFPMASLIHETAKIQTERNIKTKIVADGGFKKYSDVIKALALGADYVMLGSIFNKALESCGETYEENKDFGSWKEPGDKVDQYSIDVLLQFEAGRKFFKKFRGMSTKEAQKSLGRKEIKTSEGISKMQQVEYTLSGWCENFQDYLKSAMSYTDCLTLGEFIGKVRFNKISKNSFDRFHK